MKNQIEKNIQSAFSSLFDGPEPVYKTPWEKCNMSYAEWYGMYVKACDDAVKFRHEVETGKFFNEEA